MQNYKKQLTELHNFATKRNDALFCGEILENDYICIQIR